MTRRTIARLLLATDHARTDKARLAQVVGLGDFGGATRLGLALSSTCGILGRGGGKTLTDLRAQGSVLPQKVLHGLWMQARLGCTPMASGNDQILSEAQKPP